MHTLASPASVVTPAPAFRTQLVRCPGCHSEHAIPADSWNFFPMCHACRKSSAWAEARKLVNDVKDLRSGTGIFADLTLDERLEQLEALGFSQSPTLFDDTLTEAARMPEVVRKLASDLLVDLAGHCADEIGRRMGSADVHPADRTVELVQEAAPSVDEYATDSALRIEIENQLEDEARELVLAQEAADEPERWDGLS